MEGKRNISHQDYLGLLDLGYSRSLNNPEVVELPLYQDAFDFLVDKYDSYSYITPATKYTVRFYIEWFDGKKYTSEHFDNHLEARQACLKKVIDIIKNDKLKYLVDKVKRKQDLLHAMDNLHKAKSD